jgi:uncharacterized membrane protein YkvA (DUF1232 family)
MLRKLKFVARDLKRDLGVYQMALRDPRTPRLAKALLGFAVTYALFPVDLIPDFLPLIGHIDDAVVIPMVIRLALKMIPEEVIDDCRLQLTPRTTRRKSGLRRSRR